MHHNIVRRWMAVVLVALSLGATACAANVDYDITENLGDAELSTDWDATANIRVLADPDTSDDTIITVENTGSATANNLTITANDNHAAIGFAGTGEITFNGNATLRSSGDGTADLAVGTGASVVVKGTTALETGAYLGVAGTYSTSGLTVNSDSLGVEITGNMAVTGVVNADGVVVISESGSLTLDTASNVKMTNLTLNGSNATLNLNKVANDSVLNATITQGRLVVSGTSSISLGAGSSINNSGGTITVENNGMLSVETVSLSGGSADIAGTLNTATFGMTGGTLSVSDTMSADTMTVSGGTVNILSNSNLAADTFTVDGAATVTIAGTVADGTAFTASAGNVIVNSTATFGDASGTGLAELNIAGDAALELEADAVTQSFSFSGGTINIRTGNTLRAEAVSGNFSGNMLLDGGNLDVGDGFSMSGASAVISASSQGGRITVGNSGRLTVGAGSTLDASSGNIELAASGGLNLQGNYIAGYDGSDVTKVTITDGGGLTTGSNTQVQLSTSLQSLASATDLENEAILVLMTDTTAGDTLSLEWDSNATVYYYELRRNPDDNNKWGLYLIGAGDLNEAERYQRLLDRWNKDPKVQNRAGNLIRRDFGRAISDAARLVAGGGFNEITTTRQFNGRALNSLLNAAEEDTVGYDALMLYNGSGLGLVNQAVMDSNAHFMRLLGRRTSLVRNEYMAGQTIGSDMALASGSQQTLLPNRAWAALFGQSENSAASDGFAGYNYKPHGVAVGYDRLIGNITVGGSFAYAGGDFKDKAALSNNSEIDSYAFALYGGYNHYSGIFVTGSIGYGYSDNSIRDYRILNNLPGWNRADYHTNTYMTTLSVGYDWNPVEYLTISPSVGFAYQHATNSAHSQYFTADNRTAAANTLNAGKVKNHSTTMPLDLAISYDFMGNEDSLLTFSANIGWAHEFHNQGASGNITYGGLTEIGPVGIVSRKPGRNILNVGVAAKYIYKRFEFGASYDYVHRKNYNAHNYSANFGINF